MGLELGSPALKLQVFPTTLRPACSPSAHYVILLLPSARIKWWFDLECRSECSRQSTKTSRIFMWLFL